MLGLDGDTTGSSFQPLREHHLLAQPSLPSGLRAGRAPGRGRGLASGDEKVWRRSGKKQEEAVVWVRAPAQRGLPGLHYSLQRASCSTRVYSNKKCRFTRSAM